MINLTYSFFSGLLFSIFLIVMLDWYKRIFYVVLVFLIFNFFSHFFLNKISNMANFVIFLFFAKKIFFFLLGYSFLTESLLTIIFILIPVAAYSLLDRKIMALVQRRKGPNIIGL